MADRKQIADCRKTLAAAFQALSDEAVRAGWPECDVALALVELAEERVMEISARAIVEGSISAQFAVSVQGRRSRRS
jgi:hypothetical protein